VLELLLRQGGYLPRIAATGAAALRRIEGGTVRPHHQRHPLARSGRLRDASANPLALGDQGDCALGFRPRDAKRSREAGFAAHLVKPMAWEKVLQTIEQVTATADNQ